MDKEITDSLKEPVEPFYNPLKVRFAILGAGIFATIFTAYVINHATNSYNHPEIKKDNVLGIKKSEIYIEYNGIQYFSHVDGKEISDLVK